MKVQPVAHYSEPRYPTRLEVLDDPDLLLRNQPAGWKKVPGIATALACFLTAEGTILAADKDPKPDGGSSVQTAVSIVVAPLSKHGEGRGAIGCVVANPPVFLSEDEAFAVIKQELAKHGINLTQPSEGWEQVQVTPASPWDRSQPYRMLPDGENRAKRIAVEFIAREDHEKLMGRSDSSIERFDFIKAAEYLRSQLGQAANSKGPRTYLGVFYDPVARGRVKACEEKYSPDKHSKYDRKKFAECVTSHRGELERSAAAQTRKELRQQVADFAAWLKGQGVL